MYKSRALIAVIVLALVAVFVVWAILPAIKGGSEGYAVKPVPQATTEQAAAPAPQVAEPEPAAPAAPAEPETTVTAEVTETVEATVTTASDTTQAAVEAVEETVSEAAQAVEQKVDEVTEAVATAGASGDLYSVVDGNKLDTFSYEGFKLYRNWCARCHGTYGQGMVGPNLAESLNIISKEQFVETVTNGKTGQIGSMPAWSANDSVMSGMDNLYAYLKARADGAIGEVKPRKQ